MPAPRITRGRSRTCSRPRPRTPTRGLPSTRRSWSSWKRPERRQDEMTINALDIRRSSASLWGGKSGLRTTATVSKFIDTTTCIGCKACEAACQEWNDLGTVATQQTGTYQTLPTLQAQYWNLIRFNEHQ